MKHFAFEFLTRPGCHLCDEARPVVLAAVQGAHGVVHEVDIDTDDRLLKEYGMRIPVLLTPDGEVVAEGVIEARSLQKSLRRYEKRRTRG